MNNLCKLVGIVLITMSALACTEDASYTAGVWNRRSDFDGLARNDAAGFTIGNKGYISGGYRGSKYSRLNDCWEYDIVNDYWTQCADMPGVARNAAVGFAIGEKGYITTGYNGSTDGYLADTWEYNPATDAWTQKDDYKGGARNYAVAFAIGDYGYVGTGNNGNYQKDFYRFDPSAASGSQWTILNGFGGQKRQGGTAFVINDKAYICGGDNNGSDVYDFWSFDPAASSPWTQLRDIADTDSDNDYDDDYTSIVRTYGSSFVIDGKGYLALGQTVGGSLRSNYWIYDPSTDLWDGEDLTPFEGSARIKAVCFSTGKRGVIATGGSSSSTFYDDAWELDPYSYEEE
ncbi:Kelch repeat-containing protein [Bacteroides reticulotermitis]